MTDKSYALVEPCGCCRMIVMQDAHKSEVRKMYQQASKDGSEVRLVSREEAIELFCGPRCTDHPRPPKSGDAVRISTIPAAPLPQQTSMF